MKSIFTYAIKHTDSDQLKHKLIDVLNNINDDKIERFVEIFLECQPSYTLPAKVYNYNKAHIRVFKSFDYLNDRVDYTYEETITKFFITQEEADKYAATGEYIYSRISNSESDEYPIEASYTCIRESYITINEWLNAEVVVE